MRATLSPRLLPHAKFIVKEKLAAQALAFVLILAAPPGLRARQTPAGSKPVVTFAEVSPKSSGISWVHNNARTPERFLPETVGAGCAFFDYDNDGWMDIYLVNSGPSDFYSPSAPLKNALYRNNRDGSFTDVTDKAGVRGGRFGMGVAAGDFDSDGWQDLYVTNYGSDILYRNRGDGTFEDVTRKAGVIVEGWSTCAVWFDYDSDGRLDLFVASFVHFEQGRSTVCSWTGTRRGTTTAFRASSSRGRATSSATRATGRSRM